MVPPGYNLFQRSETLCVLKALVLIHVCNCLRVYRMAPIPQSLFTKICSSKPVSMYNLEFQRVFKTACMKCRRGLGRHARQRGGSRGHRANR